MGLINAAKNAFQDVFADTWREYFYCDRMDDNTLMVKGEKKVSGKSSNKKGTDNVISNGSIIAVNEGQCMLIIDQGRIAEVCAEAGEYIYDSSTEPSIFYGNLGENIKKYWETFFRRVTTGGDVAKDQRVYFVNIREIFDNKFGTQQPIQYRFYPDPSSSIPKTLRIRCNGEFSFCIKNPLAFYKTVAANVTESYEKTQIFSFLRSSMVTALQPAFGSLAKQGYHYGDLINAGLALGNEIKAALQEEWLEKRGIEFGTINVQSMTLPEEDQEWLDKYETDKLYSSDQKMNFRDLAKDAIGAMETAAGNENGAFTGLYGVGMMGNAMNQMGMNPMAAMMGGMMNNGMQNNGAQNNAAQNGAAGMVGAPVQNPQTPAPTAESWNCACGAICTGKFCTECGTPKPMAGVWTCTCGAVNKGKFCSECGAKKPADAPLYRCDKCGWEPEDPKNPPKFCPECGDKFTDDDIQ